MIVLYTCVSCVVYYRWPSVYSSTYTQKIRSSNPYRI